MLTAHEVEVFTALRNAIYMLETDGRNGKRRALDALYLIKYSFEPLMRDAAPPAAPPPDALAVLMREWYGENE